MEAEGGDVREVQETFRRPCYCGKEACMISVDKGDIYDDRQVDEALTIQSTTENPYLARFAGRPMEQEILKEKYGYLFPRQIYGFVLRNRTWSELQIPAFSPDKI
jgi:hypothetical protein